MTHTGKMPINLSTIVAGALIAAAILMFVGHVFAQDDTAGRAKLAEIVAFANLGATPCAYTLEQASANRWNGEVLALLFTLKPPLTEAELAAKNKEAQDYHSQLGDAKWCELYAVEMHEAHLLFSIATNQQ
jgi:hypothetical protein